MTHIHTPLSQRSRTALIIGATGSFGGHVAAALLKHGWAIRALAREPASARRRCGDRMPIDWVLGDAMNATEVKAAAAGVDVIVHAANPPGYRNWRGLAPRMLASSVAAAKASGARIVLPGKRQLLPERRACDRRRRASGPRHAQRDASASKWKRRCGPLRRRAFGC